MAVFRVEKTKDFTIMSNHHLRNTELSLKAKGLLSLMLSLPEDWDYTTKGLAHICKDGVDSITTALKELERHGYLTRQRLRYDNGQLGDIEYTIHEQPVSTENTGLSPKRENPRQVKPEQAKPKQAEPEQANPVQLNTNPLKTKKSKKDKSITYPSIYPAEPEAASRTDGMDRIELIEAYREIIKENIEYDLLILRYGRERLDEALELMLEVILSKRPYIRIAGDDFPREIVKSRFLKINSGHLEYVFDCIDNGKVARVFKGAFKVEGALISSINRNAEWALNTLVRLEQTAERRPSVLEAMREQAEKTEPAKKQPAPSHDKESR